MRRLYTILLALGLWQAAVWAQLLPAFVLPGPWAVAKALWSNRALLAEHGLVTLGEVGAGIGIGLTLGLAVAVLMTLSEVVRGALRPVLTASQALPVFVLAPVLTIWFGYGPEPKIAMTVLLVFFPVASGFLDGLLATPPAVLDLARMTRASRWRELLWLRLPHALPHLGAGLRIAVTYAPTGAVIGEWVGASKGLGYLMLMANARSRIDLMFAALVLIVAMTLALNAGMDRILRRAGL
ncbi:Hydroxymethylpyrimidine ABC transporter, transmembrane component [Rhodovulum sp. P5]|uniref:ABC transporter permease n=1 Tax=Rhodovulum sp. P5 TaxID=1564506 RepID=UPI0009C2DF73|nr:ABC transporter permease [Rhodovulum sp. P5]ARE39080.1 Hydroxymethylpyrimidine ABC transporter, transmembrane component [Rhodovulum sp. P5]